MTKVALVARMTAAEGKRDELVEAFGSIYEAVAKEEGTEVYALHVDAGDPDVVWFYELYRDMDALTVHGGSEAMKAAGAQLTALMAGRPELTFLTPVRAKGLAFDDDDDDDD
jgi:quinol monooxygenase YgiN